MFYLYIICLKEGGNIKKNRAFSVFEIILSIFIFSLLLNIAFLKYKDFRELQAINEAKAKIVETFYLASSTSLKLNTRTKIKLDLTKKQIILKKNSTKTKTIKLPQNLIYYHTRSSNSNAVDIEFTTNGNTNKSFSIYLFNMEKNVRYKISFYGFDRSKFLKINCYRKKKNADIKYSSIGYYHDSTNEDRDTFYRDWKKEWVIMHKYIFSLILFLLISISIYSNTDFKRAIQVDILGKDSFKTYYIIFSSSENLNSFKELYVLE